MNGPTAVFKSVSKLPTADITGGVLLGGIFMLTDYSTSPATEWGKDGINVNVVCPLAWTAALENFQEQYPEAFARSYDAECGRVLDSLIVEE